MTDGWREIATLGHDDSFGANSSDLEPPMACDDRSTMTAFACVTDRGWLS